MFPGRQFRRRIMSLLDTVSFDQTYPEQINLEFFDIRLIQQVRARKPGSFVVVLVYFRRLSEYNI